MPLMRSLPINQGRVTNDADSFNQFRLPSAKNSTKR
jgi:hypothetical protein